MTQLRNTLVSNQEADALKEMIFKRARERAENLENNIKNSMTTSTHNDVMELARNSFISTKNPFSSIKEQKTEEIEKTKEEKIKLSQRRIEEIKQDITRKNDATYECIANSQVQKAMIDARQDFSNRKTFMGALNFLNAQASISLINKRTKSFEALA